MGEPSILVNNAGIDQPPDSPGGRHHLHELPIDEFRRMVEVNLLGTFQVTQVFGERMAAHGGGSIINIGSLYASVSPDPHFYDHLAGNAPFIKSPAYGASKAAVVNLSKFFATHWAGRGVRVNTLSPGGVLAGQDEQFKAKYGARVPLGRMADAEDLKGPLVFLASPRLVVRHRPRAARRRRLHGVVMSGAASAARFFTAVVRREHRSVDPCGRSRIRSAAATRRPPTAGRSRRWIRRPAANAAGWRDRARPTCSPPSSARRRRSRPGRRRPSSSAARSCARSPC